MDTAAAAVPAAAAVAVYEENASPGDEGQSSAVDKMCRLCCCSEGQAADLSLLFPEGSTYEANKLLLKKIYECTTVQITNEGDDQNAMICTDCIAKIDDFYSYREQCRANDDRIRQRAAAKHDELNAVPEIHIKQEKDLQLEINDEPSAACEDGFHQQQEDPSHPRPTTTGTTTTTTTNEFHGGPEHHAVGKDEDSLLQPMGSKHRNPPVVTDETICKREVIVDDDEVYYNSDGEAVSVPTHFKQNDESHKPLIIAGVSGSSISSSGKKSNYRIIMTPTNRERLVYQGYLYCRHFSRRDGSVHWRCRLGGCQAAVNLNLDNTITPANHHGHCHGQNAPFEGDIIEEPYPLQADNTALLESFGIHYGDEDMDLDDSSVNLSELTSVGEESLRIVPNKKKGETLVHLGFKYCKRYVKMDGSTYWKCRSNNNKCSAGLYVYPEAKVRYHGTHNHDKVVGEAPEYDMDSTLDDSLMQPFTIVEDVEDDEEGEQDYNEDMAALLTPSVEVMMSDDQRQQVSANYEVTTNVKGRECLIFEGHQYSKDRERYDGAVLWRCRRNYDKCRAIAIIYADGRIEKSGEHRHETDKRYLERQDQGIGSRMFRITKNQRGNDALVFEGHRFSKEWSRVDGSIIWRCSYRSGMCRVKVVLNADAYIHRMGAEHEHEHEQTEAPVEAEYCEEDVEVLEDSLLTPARSQPKLSLLPQCPNFTTEQQMEGGYRIVRNRKGFEALVHDGFRYCKVRVRQDGSIKWLCKMNKKTCRAAVDLFPDGSIAKATEYDHNHERPNDMDGPDEDEEGDAPGQEITYPIDPEVFGNSQWYYVKNSKNGISMIHAGYRYTKKCERVDGTSLWRCSASQRGCKAGVILFPNDTLAMVENAEHSHKPSENVKPADLEQESEEQQDKSQADVIDISEQDDEGNDSEMNMHSLLQTVLGGDDDITWMGGGGGGNEGDNEQGNESVWFNSSTDRPYPRPPNGQQPNFRIIKNRRNTDSLVHQGYRYCKIRDRVDGSILWTCQMNKKTCKASVNLTVDGRVEVINAGHNHDKTDRDDGDGADVSYDQNISYDISSDVDLTTDDIQDEPEVPPAPAPLLKHPDYYYSINKINNECLIHKGYRMSKKTDRPDGSTTWKCSMGGNTCMAGVTIHSDGTPEENQIKHNHQPLVELPPEIERVVKPPPPPPQLVKPPVVSEPPSKATAYKRQGDSLEWEGFHYRKIKELPDGCIIWICHVDSCRVAVKMLPTGQLKMLSESEHNHTASGQPLSLASASGAAAKPATTTDGRARSYRLFKNQRGQMTLLYQGYRYSIRNKNQDGSSSWKCRSNSKCRAIIFLMPDDRIVHGNNNAGHNHDPNWESTKKLESVAPTRVNPLYDYLNIIPGGSNSRPPSASLVQDSVISTPSIAAASNAKPSEGTNYGRNVVEHKNYFYRLIVRKKNGREYWRCVHFKNRACRAALFCRDNGAFVASTNGKEHNHKGGADARPMPPSQFAIAGHKSETSMGLLEASRSAQQPSPVEEVQLADGDEERYIDHGDYVIAKNRKDQNTLIYKDRRYYLSYNRSDGSAVWRCAHRKRYKCYAYVRLRPDGRLLSTGEQDHSHSMKTEHNPPAAEEAKPVKNYKIVKNRVGNDILIHENHRFRLNYQRNDGTTHWRCVWARSNHCSAGVYLFANGVLKNAANESAIVHNHPPPSQVRKATNVNTATVEPMPGPSSTQPSFNAADRRTIPEDEGITDFKFVEEGSNKVLCCRGYRYWYTWVRKDGSIYYRCAEVKKLHCTMGILLLTNGKLVRAGDQCHNHDPSQEVEEEDNDVIALPVEVQHVSDEPQMQEEVLEQYAPLVIPQGGDNDFKIAKTSRGESLIYQGYRYWAKNRLANGIVSLCCTRKKMKKCPAMLRLLTNGRVTDPVGLGHTHPPNIEGGGGDISMLQPVSVTVTSKPVVPKPAVIVREPSFVVKPNVPASQLPPLSFNEESEDDTEEGEEAILGSKRYTFMKSSAQRNFIVFEGFVYDFEHKQHDGCVFYRCKTSESCPATLMLLSNGRVMHLADSMHTHKNPDLSIFRPVGRGSKEFKIVQNKNGSNILVHRGHRYTTPRSKTDGAGIWYCHTYVPEINRRCYVPIELLPNGRVAPVGDKQHSHNPPFKAKPEPGMPYDTKDNVVKAEHSNGTGDSKGANNRMLLHGGHRYNFANKRDDGAILWKCIEKSCNASMYRLTDGHIVKGPEHNHDRMETLDNSGKRKLSDYETKPKIKNPSPSVIDGDSKLSSTPESAASYPRAGTAVKPNPYIGKPIIHEGYRYIYYLTRRDGSEHWRCSRRLPMKCRGGLFKLTDGTLVKSNEEGHSHPPYVNMDDSTSLSLTITEMSQESYNDSADVEEVLESSSSAEQLQQQQPSYMDDEGSYDYELIDVKGKKRGMYLIHKGAKFVAGHTRRDRARYYRCRTVGCKVAMLLHRNGLLVRMNDHTHDCQNAIKTEEPEKEGEEDDDEEQDGEDHNGPSTKKQRLQNDEESMGAVEQLAVAAEKEPDSVANGEEDAVVEVKEEPADEH